MIVITIIMAISAFTISTYTRNTRVQQFEHEISKYIDTLNFAKQNALFSNTEGFQCPDYQGHKISMDQNGTKYSLQMCCYEACDCVPTDTGCLIRNIQDYTLHRSVEFTSVQDIHFRQKTEGLVSGTEVIVTIKSIPLNECVDITIQPSGLIERGDNRNCP